MKGTMKTAKKGSSQDPPMYQCKVKGCNQECVNKYTLRAHLRLHTGEEPFECPEVGCDRRFRWRSSLRSHRQMHLRQQAPTPPSTSETAKASNKATVKTEPVTLVKPAPDPQKAEVDKDVMSSFTAKDEAMLSDETEMSMASSSPKSESLHTDDHVDFGLLDSIEENLMHKSFDDSDRKSASFESGSVWEVEHGWEEHFDSIEAVTPSHDWEMDGPSLWPSLDAFHPNH